ncbi:MAG: right-handed parallel beta-helix repeat-containing protein [Verrucomicrobiaceae bacterium]|nr:MAG: right-handed parallel beta-helix repeat-containing protein [Verrucomicrobiaceae bacterium]
MRRVLILALAAVFAGNLGAEVIDIRKAPYSAAGDGKTDDRGALAAAFSAAEKGDTILVPAGDYRIVMGKGRLTMPDGVTLLGEGGRSKFHIASQDGKSEHREFLQPGSSCLLQGLAFSRAENFPAVLFPLFGERDGITFRDCVFEGGVEQFPGTYCHAFQVGNGALKNLTLEKIELRGFTFGLFQANQATGSVEGVVVRQSLFEKNKSSDLEFNSPKGKMTDIRVMDCTFRDNLSKTPSGGFAVGFANVQRGSVERCRIENYGAEALHVEDRSEDIRLAGNTIVGGSKIQTNGVILVVNDSRNVVIEGNYVDGRPNENKVHLVLVTAGGPKFPNPSGVLMKDNVLLGGAKTVKWYLQKGSGPEPVGNLVVDSVE